MSDFEVGDIVKIKKKSHYHDVFHGNIGTIKKVEPDNLNPYKVQFGDDEQDYLWLDKSHFKLLTKCDCKDKVKSEDKLEWSECEKFHYSWTSMFNSFSDTSQYIITKDKHGIFNSQIWVKWEILDSGKRKVELLPSNKTLEGAKQECQEHHNKKGSKDE